MDLPEISETKILQVTDDTTEDGFEEVVLFSEGHRSIDITIHRSIADFHHMIREGREYEKPLLQIHKFESMSDELQQHIAEFLAEEELEFPIILFDADDSMSDYISDDAIYSV